MQETIPLGKIKVDRKVQASARKQQLDLANHIARNGLQVPVLVDANYQLIDGLRRMAAAEALGVPEITVTVARTYDDAVEALAEAHDPAGAYLLPLTSERIWQITESIRPLMRARIRHATGPRGSRTRQARDKNYARGVLAKALHVPSESYISNITFLYLRKGREGDEGAFVRLAIKKMEAGEWTPYTAKGNYDRWRAERSQTADEGLQRTVLSRATANLIGTVRPISDVGALHHGLSDDELFAWERSLSQVRTVITKVINKINKELEGRGNE